MLPDPNAEPVMSHCRTNDVDYPGPCSAPYECVTCGRRFTHADVGDGLVTFGPLPG